jgi:hypothetical protein
MARAVESAVLNFTSLLESSVACRNDATRAIDQLCQRITASQQFQPQNGGSMVISSNASMRSNLMSIQPSDYDKSYDIAPLPPAGIRTPNQVMYQRALPPLPQHSLTTRRPSDTMSKTSRYRMINAPPQYQAPQPSPRGWNPTRLSGSQIPPSDANASSGSGSTAGEEKQSH